MSSNGAGLTVGSQTALYSQTPLSQFFFFKFGLGAFSYKLKDI